MDKLSKGVLLGIIAGIIDLIPMVLQGLSWDASLSAFFMWVIAGFMISTSNLKLNPILKGLSLSFLLLTPSGILIAWKDPVSLLPIGIMTLILGSALGYLIEKR